MLANTVNCRVTYIEGGASFCPGGSRVKSESSWTIGGLTPKGMCARSYMSIFPVAAAMRFSQETPWERGQKYVDVTCPEGHTKFRLSRVNN